MTERGPLDRRSEREADAAAAAAGSIGGRADEEVDPAERPVREADGGEADHMKATERTGET